MLRCSAHLIPAGRDVVSRRRQEHRLRTIKLIVPTYSEQFHCIGPACEDTCCIGWTVAIDQATFEKYQTVPAGPLRELLDANVLRMPNKPDGSPPTAYAHIRMALPERRCPLLNEQHLCQIQIEHGEEYLSQICSSFPRVQHIIDQHTSKMLTLSCPEAARLVLLNPDLLAPALKKPKLVAWDDAKADAQPARVYFWPIREFAINLILNRSYPLWQRMFLLGTFSRRLDAIVQQKLHRGISALLADFSTAIRSGELRVSMESIPADLELQLRILVDLVQLRTNNAVLSPRLQEVLQAFLKGTHMDSATSMKNQMALYADAYRLYYAPFFEKHPHILENYLANTIFTVLFPFGGKLFDLSADLEPAKQYALLATKFALIKGLLIGVAAHYKEAFCADHVIQTVQVVYKHFEHNPKQFDQAYQLLVSKNLDNARGLTMLLRN